METQVLTLEPCKLEKKKTLTHWLSPTFVFYRIQKAEKLHDHQITALRDFLYVLSITEQVLFIQQETPIYFL